MLHKIKMIATDLDGTLLTDDKLILPYTKKVLSEAAAKGIMVVIATGRPLTALPEAVFSVEGIRYAITSNGARVTDIQEGRAVIEHLLPRKSALEALKVGARYDTLQEIYYGGQGYVDACRRHDIYKFHKNPIMYKYFLATRRPVENVLATVSAYDRDLDEVQILFRDLKEREIAQRQLKDMGLFTVTNTFEYNLEINAQGVDKGRTMAQLGEMFGILPENIMAFGDSYNDVAMLKEAGLGVAVGNAAEAVKAAADFVTCANEDEGVAKAVEKFAVRGEEPAVKGGE